MDKIILNIYKRKRILRALCVLLLTYLTFFIAGYLFLGMPFMLIFPSSFIRLDPPSFLYELETLLSDIDLPAFFLNLKPLWSDITCNAALVAAAADLIGTYDRDFRKLDSIMFRNCDFTRYMQLLKTGLSSCSAKGSMSTMIYKAIQTRYVNALIYERDLTAAETYLNESWRGNKGKAYFNLKKAVLSIREKTFSFPRHTFLLMTMD